MKRCSYYVYNLFIKYTEKLINEIYFMRLSERSAALYFVAVQEEFKSTSATTTKKGER
jgi:hypothetical protein